jgi:hypothetical protein
MQISKISMAANNNRGARENSRLWVAGGLILPPLILLAQSLFGYSLLPAGLLSHLLPWKTAASPSPPLWNALIWDSLGQYFPWRDFAAHSLRAGQIPLWNPYQFCGTPFLANGQSAIFYPLNLIFWLLDSRRAFGWSMLLHLILGGWFTYLFLRALRLKRFAALIGGMVFAFNGYFVTWIYLPTLVNTAIWLPLALLFGEKYLRSGRWVFAAAAGAALGLSALAGHPQIFLLCSLFFALYFVARALTARRWGLLLGGGLLSGSALILVSAVQLLPTLELLQFSHRASGGSEAGYQFYLSWAWPLTNLVTLLLPDFFGNPTLGTYWGKGSYSEYCAYAGIIPLLLAAAGGFWGRRFAARFFGLAALFWLLCALGTPLNWPLFHFVPGLKNAGSPSRLLLLYLISLSFLAGIGADWLARALREKSLSWLKARLLGLIAGAALFSLLLTFLAKTLLPEGEELTLADLYVDALPNLIWLGVVCALSLVVIIFLRPTKKLSSLLAGALVILVAADLLLFGFRFVRFTPDKEVFPATGATDFLRKNLGASRMLALTPVPLEQAWPASDLRMASYLLRGLRAFPQALFPPNTPLVYRLRDILGYDSLYLADYRTLLGELEGRDPSPPTNGNLLLAHRVRRDLLPLFGVRYLVSRHPLEGKNLRLVYDKECKVYELSDAFSRAWLADAGHQPGSRTGNAEILADDINHVGIKAEASESGWLILADNFYPGWRANVDGKEVPIEFAHRAFRAVALPAGEHKVDFYYRPTTFKVGLFALLLAAMAAGIWATTALTWGRK